MRETSPIRQFVRFSYQTVKGSPEQKRKNAYEEKPFATTYQKAVADACRTLLNELVEADEAVKYVVAAGYRRHLFDLLEDRIEAVALEKKV